MHVLTEWSRKEPGCPIEIRFNSPGGSVIDGMAFWDFLMSLKRDGHHLTTVAIGYAASMAGILLQAGDTRVMYAESWLMIHEVSFGARGKIGDIEDTVEWVKKIQARVIDIFAERSRLSKAQIKRNWARKDWWLDARESLRDGFIDEIR
jgi:ATP-dependent Clp protease protease subunit